MATHADGVPKLNTPDAVVIHKEEQPTPNECPPSLEAVLPDAPSSSQATSFGDSTPDAASPASQTSVVIVPPKSNAEFGSGKTVEAIPENTNNLPTADGNCLFSAVSGQLEGSEHAGAARTVIHELTLTSLAAMASLELGEVGEIDPSSASTSKSLSIVIQAPGDNVQTSPSDTSASATPVASPGEPFSDKAKKKEKEKQEKKKGNILTRLFGKASKSKKIPAHPVRHGGPTHQRNRSLSQSVGSLVMDIIDEHEATPTHSRHPSGTFAGEFSTLLDLETGFEPQAEGEERGSEDSQSREDSVEHSISYLEGEKESLRNSAGKQKRNHSQGSSTHSRGPGHSRGPSYSNSQGATVTDSGGSPKSGRNSQGVDSKSPWDTNGLSDIPSGDGGGGNLLSTMAKIPWGDDNDQKGSPWACVAGQGPKIPTSDDDNDGYSMLPIDDLARGISPPPMPPPKTIPSDLPANWPGPEPLRFVPINESAWRKPEPCYRPSPKSQHFLKAVTAHLRMLDHTVKRLDNYVNPVTEKSWKAKKCLTKPALQCKNQGRDNKDAELVIFVGDILRSQNHNNQLEGYCIQSMLGKGTFGQVAKCRQLSTGEYVAVKVVKNKQAYHQQAISEIKLLKTLNEFWDKDGSHHIVRLSDFFIHCNHLCLVFPLLGMNLYELIKRNKFRGLPCDNIRIMVKQLLQSLVMLHRASVIHCDLKPENILIKDMEKLTIKVIDFGSACFEGETIYSYIQSRFYRSPEVLLGLEYNGAIDMWSLGCIAAELYLGLPLYPGKNECTQLHRIQNMQGELLPEMVSRGKKRNKFFKQNRSDGTYTLKSPEEYARDTKTKPVKMKQYYKATNLYDLIINFRIRKSLSQEERLQEYTKRSAFIEFLRGVLTLDPEKRWTAWQALHHPFITGKFDEPFKPPPHQRSASLSSDSRQPTRPRPAPNPRFDPQQIIDTMNNQHPHSPNKTRSNSHGSGMTYPQQLQHQLPAQYAHHPLMPQLTVQLNAQLTRGRKSNSVPNLAQLRQQYGHGHPMPPHPLPSGHSYPQPVSNHNSPRGQAGVGQPRLPAHVPPTHGAMPQSQSASAAVRHHSMPQAQIQPQIHQLLPPIVQQQLAHKQMRAHHSRNSSMPSIPLPSQYAKQFQVASNQQSANRGRHRRHSSQSGLAGPRTRLKQQRSANLTVPHMQDAHSGQQSSRRRGHSRHHSNPTILATNFGSPQVVPVHMHQGQMTPTSTSGTGAGVDRAATGSASMGPSPCLYTYHHGMPIGPTPDQTPPSRGFATYRTPSLSWGGQPYSPHTYQLQPQMPVTMQYYHYQVGQVPPVVPQGYNPQQQRASFPGAIPMQMPQMKPANTMRTRSQSDPTCQSPGAGVTQQQETTSGRNLTEQIAEQLHQTVYLKENVNSSKNEEF